MAENENMVVDQMPPEERPQESKAKAVLKKIGAGLKEWGRKQIVTLKRSPQRIPLLLTCLTSVLWLLWLFTFSRAAYALSGITVLGLIVFAATLLSILVIPLFLNAFLKRKKPNIVFIILVFVFFAALIALDVTYYSLCNDFLYVQKAQQQSWIDDRPYIGESFTLAIVHIVFIAISALSLALMPVYAPLIKKINTMKAIEENTISGTIDIEDE